MSNRCGFRQRNYTELCNRSSTRSHSMWPARHDCDVLEDYWEDASVSLRSCHSLDTNSSPWFGGTTSAFEKTVEEDATKRVTCCSPQIRPHRYSVDVNEYLATVRGRRSFPPPLTSCSTLSIKEGGRFVLKEMDAGRPQRFFRAQRGDGRLRLQLVLPDEDNDEDDNHEGSSLVSVEFDQPEQDVHVEEITSGNHEDCSVAEKDASRRISMDMVEKDEGFVHSEGVWHEGHVEEVDDFEIERPTVQTFGPEGMESNACSTSKDAGMDVRCRILDKSSEFQVCVKNSEFDGETVSALDGFYSNDPHRSNHGKEVGFLGQNDFLTDSYLTYGRLGLNQFVNESGTSNAEQEPLWNMDVSNQALASLSPWSSKQLCLDQSIVRIRPVLGLAMS